MERTAFQIGLWRAAASRYKKKSPSRTDDRGWASILELGMGRSNNPYRDKISTLRNDPHGFGKFFGV